MPPTGEWPVHFTVFGKIGIVIAIDIDIEIDPASDWDPDALWPVRQRRASTRTHSVRAANPRTRSGEKTAPGYNRKKALFFEFIKAEKLQRVGIEKIIVVVRRPAVPCPGRFHRQTLAIG